MILASRHILKVVRAIVIAGAILVINVGLVRAGTVEGIGNQSVDRASHRLAGVLADGHIGVSSTAVRASLDDLRGDCFAQNAANKHHYLATSDTSEAAGLVPSFRQRNWLPDFNCGNVLLRHDSLQSSGLCLEPLAGYSPSAARFILPVLPANTYSDGSC